MHSTPNTTTEAVGETNLPTRTAKRGDALIDSTVLSNTRSAVDLSRKRRGLNVHPRTYPEGRRNNANTTIAFALSARSVIMKLCMAGISSIEWHESYD
jgi:hypothetical protein